ncbi:hypothetical protein [Sphingomonas parapaucimobilis]|uniref:hypothetical protein n=1 Tax=Sphingomonas parapaucimobilis TaxID=28213 RepID=UPI001427CF5A|nr:hypothetical protein [Sphingomonas parapaucimobilis]
MMPAVAGEASEISFTRRRDDAKKDGSRGDAENSPLPRQRPSILELSMICARCRAACLSTPSRLRANNSFFPSRHRGFA